MEFKRWGSESNRHASTCNQWRCPKWPVLRQAYWCYHRKAVAAAIYFPKKDLYQALRYSFKALVWLPKDDSHRDHLHRHLYRNACRGRLVSRVLVVLDILLFPSWNAQILNHDVNRHANLSCHLLRSNLLEGRTLVNAQQLLSDVNRRQAMDGRLVSKFIPSGLLLRGWGALNDILFFFGQRISTFCT